LEYQDVDLQGMDTDRLPLQPYPPDVGNRDILPENRQKNYVCPHKSLAYGDLIQYFKNFTQKKYLTIITNSQKFSMSFLICGLMCIFSK